MPADASPIMSAARPTWDVAVDPDAAAVEGERLDAAVAALLFTSVARDRDAAPPEWRPTPARTAALARLLITRAERHAGPQGAKEEK
jgi:hypothetical protein